MKISSCDCSGILVNQKDVCVYFAVNTTLVSPVSADGQPRRMCAEHDGAVLEQARQAKVSSEALWHVAGLVSLCWLLRLVAVGLWKVSIS